MVEPAKDVTLGDSGDGLCDGGLQDVAGSGGSGFEEGFDLGEGLFNRIEVGRVSGQENHRTTHRFDQGLDSGAVMWGCVVPDHDLTGLKPGQQNLLDPGLKGISIYCPVEYHLCANGMSRQSRDQAEVTASITWHFPNGSLPFLGAGIATGHGDVVATLIHKHQLTRLYLGDFLPPLLPFSLISLTGLDGLFLRVSSSRSRLRCMVALLTLF